MSVILTPTPEFSNAIAAACGTVMGTVNDATNRVIVKQVESLASGPAAWSICCTMLTSAARHLGTMFPGRVMQTFWDFIRTATTSTLEALRAVRIGLTGAGGLISAQTAVFLRRLGLGLPIVACGLILYRINLPALCTGYRDIISAYLAARIQRASIRPETCRNPFMDMVFTQQHVRPNHTHPTSAALRSATSVLIDRVAAVVGLSSFYYQCSRADERKNRAGSRSWYWVKDLNTEQAVFSLPPNSLMALVDVDHYVDMPTFLSEHFGPTLVYTLQPSAVARNTPEYSYTFDNKNQVEYLVRGGGKFVHEIWNYGMDNLKVTSSLFGVPYRVVTYLVDRRQLDMDHQLILFSPLGRWTGLDAVVAHYHLEGAHLARLNVKRGEYLRMKVVGAKGVTVSTGRPHSYACATIPAEHDDALAITARQSKLPLTFPQVQSYTDGDRPAAAALLDYHRAVTPGKPDVVFPVEEAVRRYAFSPSNYDPTNKPGLVAFMSPVIHGAYAPDQTLDNERQAVHGRITSIASEFIEPSPFLTTCMLEFSELLIPDKHQLDPYTDDDVYERQNRPTQRRIIEESNFITSPRRIVQSFIKKEAYADPKDPRIISTINGTDKVAYSKYTYAFAELLKAQQWYAFGKTPAEVAQRVVEVASEATYVANSDFSRMDGRVSNVLREFEQILYMRAFRHAYHVELSELMRSQYNLEAYTTLGVKYNTKTSRASGSPETSNNNTVDNAFIVYLAFRLNGASPTDAFGRLGLYGGDDGITADVNSKKFERAAAMVGMVVVAEQHFRGKLGVKFLARVYGPDVWFGDPNSCCDLPRQLSKLHVTVALPPSATPALKLIEKCRSFYLTDANTPVLGQLCAAAMLFNDGELPMYEETSAMRSYGSHHERSVQYPNDAADWYQAYAADALPMFDFDRFSAWICTAERLEDLLSPPLCMDIVPPKVSEPVVVDGDIVTPPIVPPVAPTPPPSTTSLSPPPDPTKAAPPKTDPKVRPPKYCICWRSPRVKCSSKDHTTKWGDPPPKGVKIDRFAQRDDKSWYLKPQPKLKGKGEKKPKD